MPSAVNSAENVGDLFFSVGRPAGVYPTVQKPLLKSLKRLLPLCKEAEKKKKRGDWCFFLFCFFFLKWLRVFLKMATNGDDTAWLGWSSLSAAGRVGELWEMRPSLVVCCIHPVLIVCKNTNRKTVRLSLQTLTAVILTLLKYSVCPILILFSFAVCV